MPADARLQSIIVNDGGTIYTYTLSRPEAPRSGGGSGINPYINNIRIDSNDDILTARLQTLIVREVSLNYVANARTFASDLAKDIGAAFDGTLSTLDTDVYTGTLFGYESSGPMLTWQLGQQRIVWSQSSVRSGLSNENTTGSVYYYYFPASVSEQEAQNLITVVANSADTE